MTRAEAEEVLDEAGSKLAAAEAHFESAMLVARQDLAAVRQVWRDWDLQGMLDLDLITAREADLIATALDVLDGE